MSKTNSYPTIGITLGDQAGIGPEVVRKALAELKQISLPYKLQVLGTKVLCTPGQPSLKTAQAAFDALNESVSLLNSGQIDAVVTAPISKEWMHKVGFDYPGHTEFFADKLQCSNHAMCLTGPTLTVGLVTIHEALKNVPKLLKKTEIVRIGNLLAEFLRQKGIQTPRIAVCGLNPHASENGSFGNEETEIISPAIEELNKQASDSSASFIGPEPSDTLFYYAAKGDYDGVLCMYHDQGLIPLKMLDFDKAINVTLGLPKPRTSPDHGTAFNIAGKGLANHESMLEAILLAGNMLQYKI